MLGIRIIIAGILIAGRRSQIRGKREWVRGISRRRDRVRSS